MTITTKHHLVGAVVLASVFAMGVVASGQNNDDAYMEELPDGVLGRTTFFVEEFVPNRVKIDADAPDRRYSPNDPLQVTVKAEEMFGQPVTNRPVSGSVRWIPESFKPERWSEYKFGDEERDFQYQSRRLPDAVLDADGKTSFTVIPPAKLPPAALTAEVQVTVNDGGRGVTRKLRRTLDPVPWYLGLKSLEGTYPRPGEEASFDLAAVEPGGDLATTDAALSGTIYHINWHSNLERQGGSYSFRSHRELIEADQVSVNLAQGRGSFTWKPEAVGNYLVRITDTGSSTSVSQSFYVSDATWAHQPWSLEKPEVAELVLDKQSYSAGETARLLIKAPFPGTVLLTLEQDRVLSSTIVTMTENTIEVPVPLTEEMLPNVYAIASVIRPVQPAQQWLPHRAMGMVNVPVTTGSRKLDIALSAPAEVRPNGQLQVTAQVRDLMTSEPVSADIIVWAVDEGVLTLTDFQTPAPGDFFAATRRLMVNTSDFYSNLMPDLITAAVAASPTGGGDLGERARLSPVNTERVKPVVLWQGPARTDASGQLQVNWQVPQFMGRLRVMAMAAEGKRFGHGDAVSFVRNPVMMKEYLPRFLAPGDRFTAGFTVYNNTDSEMAAGVQVETGGLVSVDETAGETLTIKPRDQQTFYRTMTAAEEVIGESTIQFSARAGAESYISSATLPVRPASPRIRESASVAVQSGDTGQFNLPGNNMMPATTSVTLVVGGMPMLDLAGALKYNVDYPHGCSEQIISQLFPLLYLADAASAIEPGRFSAEGLRVMIQAGIDRVLMSQTASGGLAMWVGNREPWPWASAYGAHFLVEAERAGYQVNPDYKAALLNYLYDEVADTARLRDPQTMVEVVYANYVLARAGRKVHQNLGALRSDLDKLNAEARALLAAGYVAVGFEPEAAIILGETTMPDDEVSSATRQTGATLASPVRETAILLLSWLDTDANTRQVADLVTRLNQLRGKNNHWGTTQDNAFAMMALGRYMKSRSDTDPASGSVVINGQTHEFSTSEPLRLVAGDLAGSRVEIKANAGTAYGWYMVEGVPTSPPSEAIEQGVGLARTYMDREGNPLDPAELNEGQLVMVELKISGKRKLDNIVLQDLLPAGLEVENPRLASSEVLDQGNNPSGIAIEHTDIRDDRILVYADLFEPEGDHQIFRYTCRAVSPGEYILPPAQLDVMYDPSIMARTEPGRVIVQPRQR